MYQNKRIGLIIAAAGLGTRMGGNVPKLFLPAGKARLITTTVAACTACGFFDCLVVVTHPDYMVECKNAVGPEAIVVPGGKERQDSVAIGLSALGECCPDLDYILIHDGARPYVTTAVIEDTIALAIRTGAAVAAVPVTDTIKQLVSGEDGTVTTPDRAGLYAAQTPQGFKASLIREAYENASLKGLTATDDAQLVELMGHPVALARGDYANIKITTPSDLPICQRAGTGFDAHRLTEGRPLILGGIQIPFEKGLLGHSDADVLTHAIMDALLGAAGMGDIGRHFPDTDEEYRGISSMLLLKKVVSLIQEKGFAINNVDATLIAQRPKIAPYIPEMTKELSRAMGIEPDRLNIKATTTEKLGIPGREEGMAAEAVCILTGQRTC